MTSSESAHPALRSVELHILLSVVDRPRHGYAILQEAEESYVFILNGDVAEKRAVKLGLQHVLDVEILEGLNPGDELVVEGQLLLEPGSKVKVVE